MYDAKNVAKLLDLSVGQVRSYARDGLLRPGRGPRGEYRFSFQDVVLLRTAKGLLDASVPPRKVRNALRRLKEQLPAGRPLTGVRISASGDRVVVQDRGSVWNPETGQQQFDFEVGELVSKVAPHARRMAERALASSAEMKADDWYALASDLEVAAPEHAQEAYRRALDVDPEHFGTRVNLGRLLHEKGKYHAAEAHYRLALAVRPKDATALFNLSVCLEDLGRSHEAIRCYCKCIDYDAECADAHYNLARLYEARGESAAALRHLQAYRQLTQEH